MTFYPPTTGYSHNVYPPVSGYGGAPPPGMGGGGYGGAPMGGAYNPHPPTPMAPGAYGYPPQPQGAPPPHAGYPPAPGGYGQPPPMFGGAPIGAPIGTGAPYPPPPVGGMAPRPPPPMGVPPPGPGMAPPPSPYGGPTHMGPPPGAYGPPPGAYGPPHGAPPPGAYGPPHGAHPPGAYGPPHGAPPPMAPPPMAAPPPVFAPPPGPPPPVGVGVAVPVVPVRPVGGPMPPPGVAAKYGIVTPGLTLPDADADRLYYAMKGLGTDDTELIEIIGGRPRPHLAEVAKVYKQRHGHDLIHDIKWDTSFSYKKLLIALVKPIGEYLADLIYDAVDGIGTKEKELIDVICQVNPMELSMMKEVWKKKYSSHEMEKRIVSETSFNFKKVLVNVLRGSRMPPGAVDMARVEMDADILYRAGERRIGTDDATFIEIITRSSAEHLQLVSAAYGRKRKHTLERAIEKETSGDYRDALLALCTPRPVWTAQRIHDAVDGLGTNDSLLIRQFALNDKPMLFYAAQAYRQIYGKDMATDVARDTSGDYKKLLCRILRP